VKKTLGTNVSLPGFIAPPELARLYASSDLLAVASEVEIHSMVAVEAMCSGCPTFIANKSGIAELFSNTNAMRTIDSGVDAWTKALREFATNAEMRTNMRAASGDYSRDHLASWQDVLAGDVLPIWQKTFAESRFRKAA
jgi:glycosyltransferase involved in cell wall biosynthesis